jgi:hypothetical protein
MNARFKAFRDPFTCILLVILAATVVASGQSQTPSAKQLTDAEAQALMQRVAIAPAASKPLTAVETRALMQYASNQAAQQAATAAAAAQAKAQKTKTVRIGLVMPKADLGPGYQGDSVAEPLRSLLSRYLSGPIVELVALDSLVTQQAEAEAQLKQCNYILYSAVTQKKTGGNGMGLFKGATAFANMAPGVGAVRAAGGALAAAGSVANAASAAQEAASVSKGVKAKSEVSFEYKLMAAGNPAAVLSDAIKAKPAADGEDVMTPLVQQVAQAVITQVTKP